MRVSHQKIGAVMSCPKCQHTIVRGFYCVHCGFVPPKLPLVTAVQDQIERRDQSECTPSGSCDGELTMQITEITIDPINDGVVRAYVDIVFDNCLKVEGIKVIQGPTGLFVSFPAKKQRDGSHRQLAYPADAKTRMMFQQVILAEYETIVGNGHPVPSGRSASERLRALEQLKIDGLINEEEYYGKRKEILGEL